MVWIPGQSFAAGQFEVTFAEWDACLAAGGCNGVRPNDQGWGRGNRPVMGVRWADAQAYVQWLSRRTGQRYRLLTTNEWVAAAFPGGRRQNYSWGNDTPVCTLGARNGAAYNACIPQRTMPVGSFQPNAYGLYDTIGNVGEWLQDPYAPGDGRHAIIGSSWASGLADLGGRGGGWDHDLGPDTGFRVARER
jgi:formylglycine-generating enzyme required for sulfatase activity